MLNRLAIVRTGLVVTTIVVTAIVRATLTTVLTAFAIIATILTVVVLTVAAGGRHAGRAPPADAVSVHAESEPADVPRQAMPDVRERPESVRKMKWKPGPKVRPGGAAARLGIALGVVLGELCLQTPGYRRFNREEADLTNSPMSLSFSSTVFAIDIQNLSQFVYAWFRH